MNKQVALSRDFSKRPDFEDPGSRPTSSDACLQECDGGSGCVGVDRKSRAGFSLLSAGQMKEKLALHSAAELGQKAREWLAKSAVNRIREEPESE